ncbi:DUF4279 domain-containing protein [Candidatus Albibeggiatoa sp. nov. NOAA]|uniref:DUF4279 domain-containing protein n=1 Tax=Candidatus Albibeggiatoa sp. nov. NOAA TaxID=3162724 RepID=UPI0033012FD0|nr:DUF4279 domain-containing protein [Thiotrichaceae bacterium]
MSEAEASCNECYVYFAFRGDDFNPDDITKELGISPTSVMIKGSRIPGKVPRANAWRLSTETVKDNTTDIDFIDVYEMALEVVNQLKSSVDIINQIKQKYNAVTVLEVVMWISVNDELSTPAVGFELDVLDFLVQTRTTIDMDIYRNE